MQGLKKKHLRAFASLRCFFFNDEINHTIASFFLLHISLRILRASTIFFMVMRLCNLHSLQLLAVLLNHTHGQQSQMLTVSLKEQQLLTALRIDLFLHTNDVTLIEVIFKHNSVDISLDYCVNKALVIHRIKLLLKPWRKYASSICGR